MSCCLKKYAKKTVVLTPQRPLGAITPLTSLTSELELSGNKNIHKSQEFSASDFFTCFCAS